MEVRTNRAATNTRVGKRRAASVAREKRWQHWDRRASQPSNLLDQFREPSDRPTGTRRTCLLLPCTGNKHCVCCFRRCTRAVTTWTPDLLLLRLLRLLLLHAGNGEQLLTASTVQSSCSTTWRVTWPLSTTAHSTDSTAAAYRQRYYNKGVYW